MQLYLSFQNPCLLYIWNTITWKKNKVVYKSGKKKIENPKSAHLFKQFKTNKEAITSSLNQPHNFAKNYIVK